MKNSYNNGSMQQMVVNSNPNRVNQISNTMHSSSVITDDPDNHNVLINTNQKDSTEYSP